MKKVRAGICFGALAFLLSAGAPHYIYVAPLKKVVLHVDLVVRGSFDAKSGVIDVVKQYTQSRELEKIKIHNAADLPAAMREGDGKHDAILFLRSFDDRYYLPVTTTPDWVTPPAGVKVVRNRSEIFGLHQFINGDPLTLQKEKYDLQELEKRILGTWQKLLEPLDVRRLKPEDLARFRAASEPWVDYYERSVKREPSERQLELILGRLSELAKEKSPNMRFRVTRTLLTLGNQQGSPQHRRERVERELIGLVKRLGHQRLMEGLMADIESHDLRANKRSAAWVIRRMGDKQVELAKKVLLKILKEKKSGNLQTNAYFALVYLGCEEDAKKLR